MCNSKQNSEHDHGDYQLKTFKCEIRTDQDDQEEDQVIEKEENETFTCEICIERVTLTNKFTNNNRCVHPFCTDCVSKYILMKLEDNRSHIKCPADMCKNFLEPLSCRPKITNQAFNKWCDVLCEGTLLGLKRVYCPNKECLELILNECGDLNLKRCECPNCRKPICFLCKVPWHAGSTCKDMTNANDIAFDALYKTNKWRMCPMCGHCVEHVGGCNKILCRFVLHPSLR